MDNDIPYTLTQEQINAVKEIQERFDNNLNPICAYPVGTGKTIIACTIIKKLMSEGYTKILIIGKAGNLYDPWEKELNKFQIKSSKISGKERFDKRNNDKYIQRNNTVLLISYDTAKIDIRFFVNMGTFDLIVMDEVHTIINSKILQQKCIKLAGIKSFKVLALTATSIKNGREDLGLIYILINKPKYIAKLNSNKINQRLLAKAVWFAEKVLIQMEDKERQFKKSMIILSIPFYKEMEKYLIEHQGYIMGNHYLFTKYLMPFLSHPNSIYKYNTIIDKPVKCGKLIAVEVILDVIHNFYLQDDKVIIFSCFKRVLDHYSDELDKLGYETVIITGKDKPEKANSKLAFFKNSNKCNILLTTLFKSAEGINIPEANHVIILEFWWNPQRIFQAIGRIDRHNQKKDIFVYLMCYNMSGLIQAESQMHETMKIKNDEAKKVILSQEELPEIKIFDNEARFKARLGLYIAGFINEGKTRYFPASSEFDDLVLC